MLEKPPICNVPIQGELHLTPIPILLDRTPDTQDVYQLANYGNVIVIEQDAVQGHRLKKIRREIDAPITSKDYFFKEQYARVEFRIIENHPTIGHLAVLPHIFIQVCHEPQA